jgi:hypothetical protein
MPSAPNKAPETPEEKNFLEWYASDYLDSVRQGLDDWVASTGYSQPAMVTGAILTGITKMAGEVMPTSAVEVVTTPVSVEGKGVKAASKIWKWLEDALKLKKEKEAAEEAARLKRAKQEANAANGEGGGYIKEGTDNGNAAKGGMPHGFANAEEFSQFGSTLHTGLADVGYADTQGILQGSAVTGTSFRTGIPFDVGRVSDFDVALSGKSLFQAAGDAGVGLRSAGTRTGPLGDRDLQALGLRDLSIHLSNQAGRDVKFMIYDTIESAVQRAPSVLIPR